jgi:hypothetical protein
MNTTVSSPAPASQIDRIKIVSRVLMVVFLAGALLNGFFLLCEVYLWLTAGKVVNDQAAPVFLSQYRALENILPLATTVTVGLGAWFGFRLFQLFGRGQLFTGQNISNTRKITFIYFLALIECVFARTFMNPAYAAHAAPAWLDLILMALPGLLVLFITWVLVEGRKLQDEQALTI